MCRLALLNKEGIEYIQNNYKGGLNSLLNHLEKSFGGHGNGYAIITNSNKIIINKGVKLSNKQIAKEIFSQLDNIKWLIYHTRLASKGSIADMNCHPFKYYNKVVAMNGTEKKVLTKGGITDTETILRNLYNNRIDIFEGTQLYDSVFIGFNGKKVFVNKNSEFKDLEYLNGNENTIIFASEFPTEYYKKKNIYISPLKWEEGEKINIESLKKKTTTKKKKDIYSYIFNDFDYESYYAKHYGILD